MCVTLVCVCGTSVTTVPVPSLAHSPLHVPRTATPQSPRDVGSPSAPLQVSPLSAGAQQGLLRRWGGHGGWEQKHGGRPGWMGLPDPQTNALRRCGVQGAHPCCPPEGGGYGEVSGCSCALSPPHLCPRAPLHIPVPRPQVPPFLSSPHPHPSQHPTEQSRQ